ncbi:MAG TPA: molecular chaperone DnaJ [Thermopetrobacter sp.]|nr:molecular chaperone DnaJ [Thermopetrobacter sp.]
MKDFGDIFDRIRIRPDKEEALRNRVPECAWPGCERPGPHPAPKGRDHEGEYYNFCTEHVRRYNKSYNYFKGMSDDEMREWLEMNATGHRPTWRLGENAHAFRASGQRPGAGGFRHQAMWEDMHELFGQRAERARPKRTLPGNLVKALDRLGLDETADAAAIKARYKELVKRLHPDANGGSRATEETLRAVIDAYQMLRKAGLV